MGLVKGLRKRSIFAMQLFAGIVVAVTSAPAHAQKLNEHLLDADSRGYKVYRTSKPKFDHFMELCRAGVTRMIVLSGNAGSFEKKWIAQGHCPTMKVVYDFKQQAKRPLSADFLRQFDQWIGMAKAEGTGIAFRCNCGCHRTGRLAAYFRMKYQGYSSDQAVDDMRDQGRKMWYKRNLLKFQVEALKDWIDGRYTERDGRGAFCPTHSRKMKKKAKKGKVCVRATGDLPVGWVFDRSPTSPIENGRDADLEGMETSDASTDDSDDDAASVGEDPGIVVPAPAAVPVALPKGLPFPHVPVPAPRRPLIFPSILQ